MNKWKKTTLGVVCSKIGSGSTPKGGQNSYKAEGISLIRSQNILDFSFSVEGLAYIDEQQAVKLKNVVVAENDILLNITGDSVARVCQVPNHILPARVNQHVSIIRCLPKVADNNFMLYLLQHKKNQLLSLASAGATRNALTKEMLENLLVTLPPLPEQKAIADTLSCLDEKIELNQKINRNLEEQAQAIFKSWFVDFEPFGGEMPEDWRIGEIGDYVDVKSGFAFKSQWWTDSGVKVIKIKNIENTGLTLDDVSFVDKEKIQFAENFVAKAGDIIVAMTGATLGKFCLIPYHNDTLLINQRVGKFFLGENPIEKAPFLWCLLKFPEIYNEIVNRGQGSAQPNISGTDIKTIEIVLPIEECLENFNSLLQPLFKIMLRNSHESKILTQLRNTLLPKLMSGEVRVPVEEVE